MAKKNPKETTGKRSAASNKTSKKTSKKASKKTDSRGPKTKKAKGLVEAKPDHDQIAGRAYEIWLRNGCPEGSEEHNWLQAEGELTKMKA